MSIDPTISSLLQELVILDLSSILAGPQVGSFFAELGARVIKVENLKSNGDPTRQWRLQSESNKSISAYYASANYGKDIVMLDLTRISDYDRLIELVKECDIIISNYQPHVASKLSTDYNSLAQHNQNLIYAQLVAYSGSDSRPGYDLVMQAETGFMSMNGYPGKASAKMPVALIDLMAAHQLKESILLALLKRMKSNIGSYIEVSLYKSAIASLANQASNYLMVDHIPQKMGSLHPNIAPYGDIFQSQDGVEFILAVGSDAQFVKLGETLKLSSAILSTFSGNSERVKQRSLLQETLQSEFEQKLFTSIASSLHSQNIPYCRVAGLSEVFDNDLAKEMILDHQIEGDQVRSVSQIAFKLS